MASAQMEALYRQKLRVWKRLMNYNDFIRGSIVTLKRPCTYKGCRKCAQGIKHPTTYYSISRKNKTQLIYLPVDIQPVVKKLIDNYRKAIALLDELSEISIKIVQQRIKERSGK